MGRLANKNILITGGNSGIGLAAAQEFDREGARVAICARARGGQQPRPSRPARPRSCISLESSAPNSWAAGFA